jgi:bacteriocin biosynthesis cyclodehydratase domain-containing protein
VPLVWRTDSSVEIGYPPGECIVTGAQRDEVAWLLSLRGDRTLDDAITDGITHGLSRDRVRHLLSIGVQTGLIDDAGAIPRTLRDAPAAVRDGLESDMATMRVMHGSGVHTRELIDRRRCSEVSVRGEGLVADSVALALTSSGVGNVVHAGSPHSSSRRHRRAALERVCQVLCDAPHPDGAFDPEAMALDLPHITVTAYGAQAVIGPLVIPGRTSCLQCRDLHRSDADSAWPRLTAQWAYRRPRRPAVASALAQMAGAWAATQVLALIDAGAQRVHAPTVDGAIIVTLPQANVTREARPRHPLCGCTWPGSDVTQQR